MDSQELWARKRAAADAWRRGGPCSVCGELVPPALKGAMSAPNEVWHRECNARRVQARLGQVTAERE